MEQQHTTASDTLASVWIADNEDGTYTNNVLRADFPDTDVIRVEDTYYLISTSMHLFPGGPILSSKDLVHWHFESYAPPYDQLLALANPGQTMDLKNGHIYDMGAWAGSIRYNQKLQKFYYLVNIQDGTPEEYAVLSVSDSASGPWKLYRLCQRLYDPGLLFEDDGTAYVIHGQGQLYLTRLKLVDEQSGEYAIDETFIEANESGFHDKPFFNYTDGHFNEGSHAYKISDTYYVLTTPTWGKTGTKKEICIQTKDLLNEPYVVKDIHSSFMNFGENGVHQGGIVDVPLKNGKFEWWSIIFQDCHKLGRTPTLQPVFWESDETGLLWPMIGAKNKNGCLAVSTFQKPSIKIKDTQTYTKQILYLDDFESDTLDLCWQWNHIPDDSKWSLTERPGHLRLHTATVTGNLSKARNTLRQRVIGSASSATIKLDISHMTDGDIAGLAVHQQDYNYIAVKCVSNTGEKQLQINDNGIEIISEELPAKTTTIWLRAVAVKMEYRSKFYYSLNSIDYKPLGDTYEMHYGDYVGMGYGAFHFTTKALGGYVDMDFFEIDTQTPNHNLKPLGKKIEAEHYDNQKYELYPNMEPQYQNNPLTTWTSDVHQTALLTKWGSAYDLAVSNLHDGDWVEYNRIDLGSGAKRVTVRASSTCDTGRLEFHADTPDGILVASIALTNTGYEECFQDFCAETASSFTGIQKLVLVYHGPKKTCRINWFLFQ